MKAILNFGQSDKNITLEFKMKHIFPLICTGAFIFTSLGLAGETHSNSKSISVDQEIENCSIMKDGKLTQGKKSFFYPATSNSDVVRVKEKDALGHESVIVKTLAAEAAQTDLENDTDTIHITRVSAKGDEALDMTVTVNKEGTVLIFQVDAVCGGGFGFTKPSIKTDQVLLEDEFKIRALLEKGTGEYLSSISNPNEDLQELRGGGGGSGRGSSGTASGRGSSSAASGRGSSGAASARGSSGAASARGSSGAASARASSAGTHSPQRSSDSRMKTSNKPAAMKSSSNDRSNTPHDSGNSARNSNSAASRLKPQEGHPRTTHEDGSFTENRGNHKVDFYANGKPKELRTDSGKVTQFRKDGSVASEKVGKVTTLHGEDGSKRVHIGNNQKYVEKKTTIKDHSNNTIPVTQRTTNFDNRTYVNNYTTVNRGGFLYNQYYPSYYGIWGPRFYDPFFHPWINPYRYTWAYRPFWGGYYRPDLVYYDPMLYLTDCMFMDRMASHESDERARRDADLEDARLAVKDADRARVRAEEAADEQA